MTQLVPKDQIEKIVGVKRSQTFHYGKAIVDAEEFYILHSQDCRESVADLRKCIYSLALDKGIDDDSLLDGKVAMLAVKHGLLKKVIDIDEEDEQ